jgi:hypothetical protein
MKRHLKMKQIALFLFLIVSACSGQEMIPQNEIASEFRHGKDLLLAQFDCKTDVDDLHTAAALATLLSSEDFQSVDYHAVAGTYGMQNGLYVPPESLFELAFPGNWSDAHGNRETALEQVGTQAEKTLQAGGDIWIAEAGQSDFSAALVASLKSLLPDVDTRRRIHIVQHSNWNEEVTTPTALRYVQEHTDYRKIPDGNAEGNGSPGFRSDQTIPWENYLSDPKLRDIWNLAIALGNQYNGAENRYLNTSIAKGGLDFSDLSETCHIMGLGDLKNGLAFFERFAD